jgi:UDP-N-acetylmuramate dehydrogenase
MLSIDRLSRIPGVTVRENVPLSQYTRFAIGGPAAVFIETAYAAAFVEALRLTQESGAPHMVIGGGTNLIVSDAGFAGVVLRFTADEIMATGTGVSVKAGATLQAVVDFSIAMGLQGLETLTGIPGSVGAALYGNAGAYGHAIAERVRRVAFFDGTEIREFSNAECEFHYRESTFKRHKEWIILASELDLDPAPAAELRQIATGIRTIRDEKYPPTMKCAGSIFKNLILSELPVSVNVPAKVVREGKVPAAYFLEQAGAKGMRRGDIHVADYHANLIYNAGNGTAADLVAVIQELKSRVQERYGLELEEEVQYVGF